MDMSPSELSCYSCGNRDRFIEVMSYESHLVDSKLNYLHLLEALVDHYRCDTCGEVVELRTSLSN
jgi:hypothetical protein